MARINPESLVDHLRLLVNSQLGYEAAGLDEGSRDVFVSLDGSRVVI